MVSDACLVVSGGVNVYRLSFPFVFVFQEYFAEFFSSVLVACFSKSNHSISGEVHRRRPCLHRGEPEAAGGDGGEGEEEGGEVPGAHQAAHLQVK